MSTTKCKVLSAAQGTFCSGSSRPFPQSLREGSIEYVSTLPVADGTGQEVFSGNERCLLPSNLARGVREQRHKHDVATVLVAGMIYLQVPWGEVGGTGWNKEKGPEQPQTQTRPPAARYSQGPLLPIETTLLPLPPPPSTSRLCLCPSKKDPCRPLRESNVGKELERWRKLRIYSATSPIISRLLLPPSLFNFNSALFSQNPPCPAAGPCRSRPGVHTNHWHSTLEPLREPWTPTACPAVGRVPYSSSLSLPLYSTLLQSSNRA